MGNDCIKFVNSVYFSTYKLCLVMNTVRLSTVLVS